MGRGLNSRRATEWRQRFDQLQAPVSLMHHNFRPLYEWMTENNPPASSVLLPLLSLKMVCILKVATYCVGLARQYPSAAGRLQRRQKVRETQEMTMPKVLQFSLP